MFKSVSPLCLLLCLLSACTIGDGPPPGQSDSPAQAAGRFSPPPPRLYPGEIEGLMGTLAGEERKTWQLVERSENGENVVLGCNTDNQLVIWRNNLISFNVGDIKCAPEESTQQFSWRLTDQRSLLILATEGAPFELVLIEASDSGLVLESRANPDLIVRERYIPIDLGPEAPGSEGPLTPLRPARPAPQTSAGDNPDRQRTAD